MKTLFLLLLILGCSWVCSFGSSLLQSSLKRKSSSSSSSSLVFTTLAFGGEKIASSGSSNTALRNSLVYLTDLSPVANNIACTALGATAAVGAGVAVVEGRGNAMKGAGAVSVTDDASLYAAARESVANAKGVGVVVGFAATLGTPITPPLLILLLLQLLPYIRGFTGVALK